MFLGCWEAGTPQITAKQAELTQLWSGEHASVGWERSEKFVFSRNTKVLNRLPRGDRAVARGCCVGDLTAHVTTELRLQFYRPLLRTCAINVVRPPSESTDRDLSLQRRWRRKSSLPTVNSVITCNQRVITYRLPPVSVALVNVFATW